MLFPCPRFWIFSWTFLRPRIWRHRSPGLLLDTSSQIGILFCAPCFLFFWLKAVWKLRSHNQFHAFFAIPGADRPNRLPTSMMHHTGPGSAAPSHPRMGLRGEKEIPCLAGPPSLPRVEMKKIRRQRFLALKMRFQALKPCGIDSARSSASIPHGLDVRGHQNKTL